MDTGQDGSDDGEDRQSADRSTDGDDGLDLEAAISDPIADGDDVVEQTGDDTHRAVGDGDPDAVFESLDEDDPQDVIAAVESGEGTPDPTAEEDTIDAVSGLFEDLGGVEAEPADAAAGTETGADTTNADTETDTGGPATPFGGAEPSPEETADEVEGLLDDLTTVDVDETAGTSGPATAHTQPTILDAEETGATGFRWLGEDIQIFSASGGDPDAVFDAFDEETPEDIITEAAGVSATGLFDDMADGTVDRPSRPAPETADWGDDRDRASVDATEMFDEMGSPSGVEAEADGPDLDLDLEGADDAGGLGDADGARTGTTDTTGEPSSDSDSASDLALDLDGTAEDIETGPDTSESPPASSDTSVGGTAPAPESEPESNGAADADASASPQSGAVEAETDVDAVFERFEAAEDPAAEAGTESGDGHGRRSDRREPVTRRAERTDQPRDLSSNTTGAPSEEDVVSDARRAESGPAQPAGQGQSRQGLGQGDQQSQPAPRDRPADGAADGDDGGSPGLLGRVIAAVRGLF